MSTTLTPPIGVRLTDDLRKYVEQQAKLNFRSVSAEAAMRIERTRREDQARTKPANLAATQPQGAQA